MTQTENMIPKKLEVTTPKDLLSRFHLAEKINYTIKLEKVEMHAFPILNVDISFGDRLAFYVKKVLPYVYEILRFYAPIRLPSYSIFQKQRPEARMNISDWLKQKSPALFAILLVIAGVASDPHLMDLLPEWASRLLTIAGTVIAFLTKPIQSPTQPPPANP